MEKELINSQVSLTYAKAAKMKVKNLCCPTSYREDLLEDLPTEILEKDYGCGDPSRFVKKGDVVLDLGSGVGKMCYMIAKIVGSDGKVTGVDMNDEMLEVARKYQDELNNRENVAPVDFVKARIQDMKVDVEKLETQMRTMEFNGLDDLQNLESYTTSLKKQPVIPNNSYDLVISNCVLNLVQEEERRDLINEIYRVLKPGGRFAISDIVSSHIVPNDMKTRDNLWGDCISGSFQEEKFSWLFAKQGFVHIKYESWAADPWKIIDNIEFRSVTIFGYKPVNTTCDDCCYQVIYKGPFSELMDDADHRYPRGKRVNLCQETFEHLKFFAPNDFVFISQEEGVMQIEKMNEEDDCCSTC